MNYIGLDLFVCLSSRQSKRGQNTGTMLHWLLQQEENIDSHLSKISNQQSEMTYASS